MKVIAASFTNWQLAGNERGDVLVVWHRGAGLYAQSLLAGASKFGHPQLLSTSSAGIPFGVLDSRGRTLAVWQGLRDGTIRYSTGHVGSAFGRERVLTAAAPRPFVRATLVSNARGDVALSWFDRSSSGQPIWRGVTRSANGRFSAIESWTPSPTLGLGLTGFPALVVTAGGIVTVGWEDDRNLLHAASWQAGRHFAGAHLILRQRCFLMPMLTPIAPTRTLILVPHVCPETGVDAIVVKGTAYGKAVTLFATGDAPPDTAVVVSDGRGHAFVGDSSRGQAVLVS